MVQTCLVFNDLQQLFSVPLFCRSLCIICRSRVDFIVIFLFCFAGYSAHAFPRILTRFYTQTQVTESFLCPPSRSKSIRNVRDCPKSFRRRRDQEPCERLHGCSKGPRLVRPVDVHEKVPGPFQCLLVGSMSTRNVQNRPGDEETKGHATIHERWWRLTRHHLT